jgi:hypothetical protein
MQSNNLKELLMLTPNTHFCVDDIVRYMRKHEASVLVNFSNLKIKQKELKEMINYVLIGTRPQMKTMVKIIYPNVLVFYSQPKTNIN